MKKACSDQGRLKKIEYIFVTRRRYRGRVIAKQKSTFNSRKTCRRQWLKTCSSIKTVSRSAYSGRSSKRGQWNGKK